MDEVPLRADNPVADQLLRVLANEALDDQHYLLTLEADGVIAEFQPGQFAMVRCLDALTLRRPFSIQRLVRDDAFACIEILYRVVGEGTAALAAIRPGDSLECLGPLGQPFTLPQPAERAVLLGGGVGVPPMVALVEAVLQRGGRPPLVIGGVGGQQDIACLTGLRDVGIPFVVATMDGSEGTTGTVIDALLDVWGPEGPAAGDRLYACGPTVMLAAVGRLARTHGLPCQVSLEAIMGCGFGACVGCAVPRSAARVSDGATRYALVCQEGPVFDACDVDLEAEGVHG